MPSRNLQPPPQPEQIWECSLDTATEPQAAAPGVFTPALDDGNLASEITPPLAGQVGFSVIGLADSSSVAGNDGALPLIKIKPGSLPQALAAAEQVLEQTGRYFQRDGRVVRVRVDPVTQTSHIQEMTGQSLMVTLATLSTWTRYDKRTGGWTAIDPCPRVCKLLAESWTFSLLKVLVGVVRQPHLRPNGTICATPGYDPDTGLLGLFCGDDAINPVLDRPTREHAIVALGTLNDLLSECAFATPEDRSAALSALLTAAVRPSLPIAPMFHVMAHQPGSGKSYLCQLISAMATPTPSSPVAFPRSNDACDKLILAQLMKAPAVIEFDNLTTDLRPYDKLCSALTSEYLEGRQMGVSRTVIVGTKALILSSGNNVRPIDDMVRRCICINLDPGLETPAARVYKRPHLLDEVLRDRNRYVGAALTVVRTWIAAGQPRAACQPLASFVNWSDWCREPLLWLDQPDPAASIFTGLKNDPTQVLVGRVLTGWYQQHGSTPRMVRDIVKAAADLDDADDFRDALVEASGSNELINVRKLGNWLSRNEGKIAGPYRLRRAPKTRNAENWEVVQSVSSVASVFDCAVPA